MKQIFFIIHIVLLTLTAYQGANILYKYPESPSLPKNFLLPDPSAGISAQTEEEGGILQKQHFQKISTRNLFKVLTQSPQKEAAQETHPEKQLEKTKLALSLWGTVTGSTPLSAYAVIEDQKEKKQFLLQVGDVIQQARIKKIMRSKIILTFNGKDQVLEVDNSRQPAGFITNPLPLQTDLFKINEASENILAGGPRRTDPLSLMQQVRIRPYFKDGKPNGLLLYGIKQGSAFQKLGLQNGDIVQELNGAETLVPRDVQRLYQDMETPSDMHFVLLRRGQKKEIIYNALSNTYTEETAPNE
ncbi:MAG: type II secretion system protein GspC [Proteobacteria bacterium]|nr:type II secretion system protein GspC [Desulfobacula sp.]MBU3951279.1 type II secretion system protein GspC [Pseudomonadota bacterium]MBU4131360.1 type II secretion system protein GspC [Pseudomonadota bacterium]